MYSIMMSEQNRKVGREETTAKAGQTNDREHNDG